MSEETLSTLLIVGLGNPGTAYEGDAAQHRISGRLNAFAEKHGARF